MKRALGWVCTSRTRQVCVLVVLGCLLFLPRLGATGFSMSEGHRVVPAWEMLDDARAGEPHWLVPRMFGTAYLRKPPGMMWAIAASSAAFGETEFAARLPSAMAATALALAVWFFATRWFGSPWGLAAGLAQVLLPVTWPSARSAEIESLHILTTGLACLLVVDWVVCASRMRCGGWGCWGCWVRAVLLAFALLGMFITKGLSGAPFVFAALVVAIALYPKTKGALQKGGLQKKAHVFLSQYMIFLLAVLFAIASAVLVGKILTDALVNRVVDSEPAIVQSVGDFLWESGKMAKVLFLVPTVLATMLPASLALLFPWGPDFARERADEIKTTKTSRSQVSFAARMLALSSLGSLLILWIAGVSNARYGLPVCALVTPLVAYIARGAAGNGAAESFVGKRPAIARALLLGSPVAWPIVLLTCAAVYVGVVEPKRRASSGREAGITLAQEIPDDAIIWADEIIEARPEVLLYAQHEAKKQGKTLRVRWYKPAFMPGKHPAGLLLLLRDDALASEVSRYRDTLNFGELDEIARGKVHKYTFVLVRVRR